jgi:protein-tyrosine kinase
MSLIEKAIEKLQQAQGPGRAAAGTAQGPFGKVVVAPRPPGTGRTPTPPARIVEINEVALRSAGLLPPEHMAKRISREYQQIKRPLVANALARGGAVVPNGQLLMVTSAEPGEGKTFTSINLAFSLALERDVQVVLADGDFLKPHIGRILGVDKEKGLMDVLQDAGTDIESVTLPTNIRSLSILPAGSRAENTTELIASDRMRAVLASMIANVPNRIVLFDSPPMLHTNESRALTQLLGQIVVVVQAGVTPQRVLLDALSHIAEGRHVALILNQSVARSSTNYYYYYENEDQGRESAPSS